MAKPNPNKNSHIGPGSIFEGNFFISGSLKIDGKFEGEIKTDDSLIIGERGRLKTNVRAREVVVSGTMIGNIEATEGVRLEKNGRVLGDITAPRVELEPGVVVSGKLSITGDQKKDIREIIADTFRE